MDAVVNYVWMNKDACAPAPIPSYFFYRLQSNAEQYPHIPFHLWVEDDVAHKDYAKPKNVSVFKLHSIPTFSEIAVLKSIKESDVWPKVDTARLVVLKHELSQPECGTAIYTDFDVEDVSIASPELKERLDQYGMALGGIIDPGSRRLEWSFGNGYLAFRKVAMDMLGFIIQEISHTRGNNRSRVHFAMEFALDKCARRSESFDVPLPPDWRQTVARLPVLFPCYWRGDTHLLAKPAQGP